mgnify:CR=1 FL=1
MNLIQNEEKQRKPLILIVDDILENLQLIGNILVDEGYEISMANSGKQVLRMIDKISPDLILLDITMPDINGFEVCQKIKENPDKNDIPIIFLTAQTNTTDIVKGFLLGGVDYITKPFAKEELLARINTHIELKFARELIQREVEKSNKLLLNVLPKPIADRLKRGETPIADHFEEASVVFIDIVDFTIKSSGAAPERIVEVLNKIYTEFDQIAKKHGLEKIKTIGDCYMAASGIPEPRKDFAEASANFAIEAMEKMNGFDTSDGTIINFRCGLDCGPVVAGVIGEHKFIYDVWGDTVNTAARMQEYSELGKIQVTERFIQNLRKTNEEIHYSYEERGEIEVKGKGMMKTFFLVNNSGTE